MGKAGKWIKNFLLGNKEEKYKKIDTFCSEDKSASMMDSQMVSPNVKRRWSFGRLSGRSGRKTSMVAGHNFSISFDSGDSARLRIQALLETQGSRSLPTALPHVSRYGRHKTAAATKIQAAFRSYLV
ncbi:putative IQ motif, EF-hand binding protein [Lupinus albus]|uniref:Putative IQ motif, EF-hand binding protein n=1 Tax=Lupinus albus TaxID=3870 RepID=A0A6A4P801_LUPAL|nr:putative IQ motif, EF-hand binding protein [Lupinus albus]